MTTRWTFATPYLILALWAATVITACGWMITHPPAPDNKPAVIACKGFPCIETAQINGGIDKAYRTQFAGKPVDCAAKTWDEGPVIVCRWNNN